MIADSSSASGPRRLSATDAFFVAYQQCSGVLMLLGGEAEIDGEVTVDDLERMIAGVTGRWPHLGQTIQKGLAGLFWSGEVRAGQMLRIHEGHEGSIEAARWRNTVLDPFREPPFQALWIARPGGGTLALRAHHAVMDGESFFAVGAEAIRLLAGQKRVAEPTLHPAGTAGARGHSNLVSRKQFRPRRLLNMWRYTRWLGSEARAGRSARLAMDACSTGDTHSCAQSLNREGFDRLKRDAVEAGVSPTAWCAAAWIRAIHSWNSSRGATANQLISLEVPVSLRRARNRGRDVIGNFISPLVVFADAALPLDQLAQAVKSQLTRAMRTQAYLSMPVLSAPAKYLPWKLFQRVAVSPKTTGFASSHFTWFEPKSDLQEEAAKLSRGALRINSQRIYTPVCLHMGAALAVVASAQGAQFFLTYRGNAMSSAAAEQLMCLLMAEVDPQLAFHNGKTTTR